MYTVIQFSASEGGTVSLAKDTWLTPRKTEVYWPPTKQSKSFNKLLEENASPDTKNWRLYGVQRVFYETDDLEKAKKKLKLAEDTSDLQSQGEDDIPKVRPKKKNPRYVSSSSEDENDKHMRPPPLKKKYEITARTVKPNMKPQCSNEANLSLKETTPEIQYNKDEELKELHLSLNETPSLNLDFSTTSSELMVLEKETGLLADIVTNNPSQSHLKPWDSTPASPSGIGKLTAYQSKVLSLLSIIRTQNEQLINMLNRPSKDATQLKPEFIFPLTNEEDVVNTEALLINKDHYDNLVNHLKIIGGREFSSKAFRILKFILKDELAAKYNFYGKRSTKKPFCQLRLKNAIVESVTSTTSATEKDVEDSIKTWLKHAPERINYRRKKIDE